MKLLTATATGLLLAGASLAQSPTSPASPSGAPAAPHAAMKGATPAANPHGAMPSGHPSPAGAIAMPPHSAGAPTAGGRSMGALVHSDANRLMVTCRIDALGNVPVLVNFVDKTALSTRSAGVSAATIQGDVVRWEEKEPGGASKYVLNRKTGEIQVSVPAAGGKATLRRGTCAPPGQKR
jgi:hypothetical protein